MKIECGGLTFVSDFDSGNLDRVEFLSECIRSSATEKSSSSSSSSPSYFHSTDAEKASFQSSPNTSEAKSSEDKKTKNVSCSSQSGALPKASPLRKAALLSNPSPKKKKDIKVLEFQVWTKPDCGGTEFENSFRSWFHFGVEGGHPGCVIKIHVVNLNRQGKLYLYGMKPVYRVLPGKDTWKRIPANVRHKSEPDGSFAISFTHPLPSKPGSVVYFAFTYPFTYTACQEMLDDIDKRVGSSLNGAQPESLDPEDAIYYSRELLCHSLDGRKVELLTVTSYRGFTNEREERLPHLFPDQSKPRCHIFCDKKVIFLSSRVHPGETPSSFVFNGFLRMLLCPKDYEAYKLRNLYVFKLIPMLNPDGVWRGHFRTDSRGVNLNRTYLMATPELHPSVYAARSLLLYYHVLYSSPAPAASSVGNIQVTMKESSERVHRNAYSEKQKRSLDHKITYKPMSSALLKASSEVKLISPASSTTSVRHSTGGSLCCASPAPNISDCVTSSDALLDRSLSVSDLCMSGAGSEANVSCNLMHNASLGCPSLNCSESWRSGSTNESPKLPISPLEDKQLTTGIQDFRSFSDLDVTDTEEGPVSSSPEPVKPFSRTSIATSVDPDKSGVAYYIDLHGHACKRGCFIYGNYFADLEKKVECMLLAKLLSINSPYFDFAACNFTAENMRSGGKKEGQNKEGCGRVALYTFTGIIRSYTLECNYNTGRGSVFPVNTDSVPPQKPVEYFSPDIYEQVGEALLLSILDATGQNFHSSIPYTSYGSLQGVKDWLRKYALSVQNRTKNDFLKRNMLNASLAKVNTPKDKSAFSSPTFSAKFSKGPSKKRDIEHKRTANTKKNESQEAANEKLLAELGLTYGELAAPNSSIDGYGKSKSDGLKNLFHPKSKQFPSTKSSPLGSHSRKSKMGRLMTEKVEAPNTSKPFYYGESLVESIRRLQNTPNTGRSKAADRVANDVKGKKVTSTASGSRKGSKPKKKAVLNSLQGTEPLPSTSLLKNDGNLRLKKMSKK